MVTFKCTLDNCQNKDIQYNFTGNFEIAICGGCKQTLQSFDLRDDPIVENQTLGETE